MLDYTVKLAIEADRLHTDFSKYPKLTSLNAQFGSRKKVSFDEAGGTLFERCEFVTTIETLRNHLIHDGLLDDMPKAYERIEGGTAVERFILLPDMTDGRFVRSRNRTLFFSKDDKINLRLPALVTEFQARQEATLRRILAVLRNRV